MTKKQLVLILVALAALIAYAYYFTDWFASENIQIVHTIRPFTQQRRGRARAGDAAATVNAVSFALDRKCKITDLKVVCVAELETNKYAHAIWHLVSESNSVPTKGFVYGMNLPGMHPAVPGATADPLEPNVTYRLFLETHDLKGEHDFKTTDRIGARK